MYLLPLVVLLLTLRLLLLLLDACPKRACHISRQLRRQSARGDACGRFVVTEIIEQACVLTIRAFESRAFPEYVIGVVSGVPASLASAVACKACFVKEVLVPQTSVIWSSLCCLLMSAMVNIQSVCSTPSIRFLLASACLMACLQLALVMACSTVWIGPYVDSCFTSPVEPEVLVDFRFPFVDVVENDGNGSVGSQRACLQHVMLGNAAGHSVVAFAALCHPSENPYRIRDDGGVEV